MTPHSRLATNFFSLSSVQVANLLLPLITMPYLVRVLGPDTFGAIAFAQAIIGYCGLISEYGFNLSATRQVAANRFNTLFLNDIFASIMSIKMILTIACGLILFLCVESIPRLHRDALLYFFTFGGVVGATVFPLWFLQGIEQLKLVAALNFLSRILFTVAIFLFVRTPHDYLLVPAISSIGALLSGVAGLSIVIVRNRLSLRLPSLSRMKNDLRDGWQVYYSTAAISLYTYSNSFILGIIANTTAVGYYSAAEKIIRAILGIVFGPFTQTIFPHMSALAAQSREQAIAFVRTRLKFVVLAAAAISIIIAATAPFIGTLILGNNFTHSIHLLLILSPIPLIVCLSNIFGIQVMLPFKHDRAFARIITITSILSLALSIPLCWFFHETGTAAAWVITECAITSAMFIFLFRAEPALFRLRKQPNPS